MPAHLTDIEYEGPFNSAFTEIQNGISTCVEKFNELVGQVNDRRRLLGPLLLWWIKGKLESVRDGLQTIIEKVQYALDHQVPVLSLMRTSFRWVTEVKTPVSDLSFTTTDPADYNLAKWTGDASSLYSSMAGKQKAAVDETVVKAEFISQWLFKMAKANVDYAVELAKIVTGMAGKITQAAIDAATVIDIPWAIDTLAKMIGDLVTAGLNNLLTIGQRFMDALGNVRDIATQVGDHSKLPGGNWPEAVRG
ncbi:MAG TPA: hypothetical protein VFX60_15635 [Micromonospora sp.]|nr:hypothetical protein [Micromonospora sp.]